MTDSVCLSFCADVRARLNTDVLLLANYGDSPAVVALIDGYVASFSGVKTTPKADQVSKNVGGDEVDVQVANCLDIFHDLDSLIPDAFIDTLPLMVEDYQEKRVEITVGTRHTILNVAIHLNPTLYPGVGATFTIKNALGVIVKVLHADLHGASETILRMAEYTGIAHMDGYKDQSLIFRPNYRSHLDLGFDLDPI